MSKMLYVLDGGIGDILEVYEEHIVIKHKGVLNMLAMGIKGDKTIDITEITSIQLKEAGWVAGYLQFSISGGKENIGGVFGATQDENTITLKDKSRNEKAKEIKEYLEKKKRELKNNKNSNKELSVADEIEKLSSLKLKGILTEEEFQKKKKELLGL